MIFFLDKDLKRIPLSLEIKLSDEGLFLDFHFEKIVFFLSTFLKVDFVNRFC